jgi:hypothetical protein
MASYEGFDAGQAKKAVAALLKHANKGKQDHRNALLEEDEFLYLVRAFAFSHFFSRILCCGWLLCLSPSRPHTLQITLFP